MLTGLAFTDAACSAFTATQRTVQAFGPQPLRGHFHVHLQRHLLPIDQLPRCSSRSPS
ncbi:MAG: hypothetical protein R3C32_12385 [Chloroflexota bacterium]